MKRRYMLLVGTVVLAFAISVFGLSVLAKEKDSGDKKEAAETAVSWEKLPPPVQQTLEAQLHTAKPEKITQETDDGYTTYEAAQTADGHLKEVKVAENGQLIEVEDAIPASDLPAAVVAQVQKVAPKAEIKEARRVTSYSYEVELGKDSKPREIQLFGNGQPVEKED